MANTTLNTSPLIKAEVFSSLILEQIQDGFLPDGLHRDVGEFGDGEKLVIPVLGETVLRDYVEDTGVEFDPIDTGQVYLQITEYVSAGTYVTDKLKQDSYAASVLEASIPKKHFEMIKQRYETDMLATAMLQANNSANVINGVAHRWVASSGTTNGVITLEDFMYAKLAADKANMPEEGRIAIVDPIVEAALNLQVGTAAFSQNPQFEGIVNTGFGRNKRFYRNIYGWDVYISNRLPTTTETINGGPHATSKTITGVANIFGVFADDQTTPFMGAWRQQPVTEGERNKTFKRDEYSTTARWGFGLQRTESLIVIITSNSVYK